MSSNANRSLYCVVAVAVLSVVGCGRKGPELAYVTGRVTMEDKPVQGATLIFSPVDGTGTTSTGQTDADGWYRLMFTFRSEGVLLGDHNVTIEKPVMSAAEAEEAKKLGMPVSDSVKIPAKYSKPNELTATVKRGRQQIDFVLTK